MVEAHKLYDNEPVIKGLLDKETFGKWMLDEMEAFCSGAPFAFYPLESLGYSSHPINFLKGSVLELSDTDRDKVNVQLATGLRFWNQDEYSHGSLFTLAVLSLRINADLTIPVLGNHIEQLEGLPEECANLIDVVSGFDGDMEPKNTLLRLYDREGMHPQLTPNLFLGLVKADPESFPPFLARFLSNISFYEKNRDQGFLPWTFNKFVEYVGWPTILGHVSELSESERQQLVSLAKLAREESIE